MPSLLSNFSCIVYHRNRFKYFPTTPFEKENEIGGDAHDFAGSMTRDHHIKFKIGYLNSVFETKHYLQENTAASNCNLIHCCSNAAYELGLKSTLPCRKKELFAKCGKMVNGICAFVSLTYMIWEEKFVKKTTN